MKILHTVEFYHPSVGGAQEVVRQVSERLVQLGHSVTVATTKLPVRTSRVLHGVTIEEFQIRGNAVSGYTGEVERYRQFVMSGRFDIMMNYAAQQWSADLVMPMLDRIPARKVLAPCGFSGLYDPRYRQYFENMKQWLRGYDHLIFHANRYRDVDFAREQGLSQISLIANGASAVEFADNKPRQFREKHGIPHGVPVIITVGTHTGLKGHALAMEVFRRLRTPKAVMVIIGNKMPRAGSWPSVYRPLLGKLKRLQFRRFFKLLADHLRGRADGDPGCHKACTDAARAINEQLNPNKRILLLDLPRAEVVDALKSSDLFFFGSNVECSPIVLFEAMASRLPFITLSCGNAAEIVEWSDGAGILAPTLHRDNGYVDGDPDPLARMVDDLLANPDELRRRAEAGHAIWNREYTWEAIARKYENVYKSLL